MRLDGTASVSGTGFQNGTLSAPTGSSKQTCVQASQAETDKSTALPQTIFLLVYDTTDFEHNGDKSDIRLPNQTFSTSIKEQPQGVLGIFRSKTQAMIEGKIWLYTQLFSRTGDEVDLPLLHEKEDNEFNSELIPVWPGTWRRSGWTAVDSYWIMDKGRSCENREEPAEVALMVAIEERVLNQVDDGVELGKTMTMKRTVRVRARTMMRPKGMRKGESQPESRARRHLQPRGATPQH